MAIKKTILSAVVGSHLHGLHTDESDLDIINVEVVPTISMFDVYSSTRKESKQKFEGNVDLFSAELNHFSRECFKNNPKFLEVLWSPYILEESKDGKDLRKVREAFLSQKVVYTFNGVINSYLDRYDDTGKDKYLKAAVYYIDLFQHVWTKHSVFLEVRDFSKFKEKVNIYQKNPELLRSQIKDFSERTPTTLPEVPNFQIVQNAVDNIRLRNLPVHLKYSLPKTKEYKI